MVPVYSNDKSLLLGNFGKKLGIRGWREKGGEAEDRIEVKVLAKKVEEK